MTLIYNIRVYNLTKEELLNIETVKASNTADALSDVHRKWDKIYPIDTLQCAIISQREISPNKVFANAEYSRNYRVG